MCGLAEALALADRLGLDEQAVLDVLAESPVGATVKSKRRLIESDEYAPNFGLSLAAKDLRLVTQAAAEAGLDLRLAPGAQEWFEEAEAAGLGGFDYSAVIALARGRQATGG
jgi:3-hydroxyisobutyrate dehydrogenase-like beta-hydroxyacid dehydrogenase